MTAETAAHADQGVWTIGVDFGTAFSKAAAVFTSDTNERQILPLHIGAVALYPKSLIVPSMMFLSGQKINFGPSALDAIAQADSEQRELLQSFKTILGANDFDAALNTFPSRRIDPEGVFTWRGLLVLYIAYLLELIVHARPVEVGEFVGRSAGVRLRYSRPAWTPARASAAHQTMVELFAVAGSVRAELGDALLSQEGLSYERARDALAKATTDGETRPNVEGGLYEASAVAACQFVNADTPACILVADIGAGTSDFACFIRNSSDASNAPSSAFREFEDLRRTITIAGDAFDAALLNLLVGKASQLRTPQQQAAFWRRLRVSVRDVKETLCRAGRVDIKLGQGTISCTMAEFRNHSDYKSAAADISHAYGSVLNKLAARAKADKLQQIGIVLAGGGAHFPAMRDMVDRSPRVGGVSVSVLPAAPAWASDMEREHDFNALFSQMSVAFGAALADVTQFSVSEAVPAA